jgi:hypothetical protein
MRALRRSKHLTLGVMIWFSLYLGAAIAAPLFSTVNLQQICTATGMKMIPANTDAGENSNQLAMDCPLCATVLPPPSLVAIATTFYDPVSFALRPIPAAHIAQATLPPLPSRGPPVQSK